MPDTKISADLNVRDSNNTFVTLYPTSLDSNIYTTHINDTISIKELLNRLFDYIEVEADTNRYALTSSTVKLGTLVYVKATSKLYKVINLSSLNSSSGYEQITITNSNLTIPWDKIRNQPTKLSDFIDDLNVTGGFRENRTYTISSSATDSTNPSDLYTKTSFKTIQSIMNLLPKNLNGKTVTINIASGTTTTDNSRISIEDFYNGTILIRGNNVTGTNYPILDSNIYVARCTAQIIFKNVQIKAKTNGATSTYTNTVIYILNSLSVVFDGCTLNGLVTGTTKLDNVITISSSIVTIYNSLITNAGISAIKTLSGNSTMSLCLFTDSTISESVIGVENSGCIINISKITYTNVSIETISKYSGKIFNE